MAQSETVDRILDAAEVLFAERGFAETSLRMITSKAKVNLAAVNYHFGSKNALIQAVFARFLGPFTKLLRERLEQRLREGADRPVDFEELMAILTATMLQVPARRPGDLSIAMRLIGLAYTQSQGHLRKFLEQEFSTEFRLVKRLVREATPELSSVERFWRVQFILGAMAFAMSNIQALSSILESDLGVETHAHEVVRRLIPFITAGMRAPIPTDIAALDRQAQGRALQESLPPTST